MSPGTNPEDPLASTIDRTAIPPSNSPRVVVETGAATHPGKVRENNEDQFLVARLAKSIKVSSSSLHPRHSTLRPDDEGYLMIVADGMGGAAAGETASTLAIETVEDFALHTFQWFLRLGGSEEKMLMSELRAAVQKADRAVIDRALADPSLQGMGTTLTMAYSYADDLFVVHAGDSRAYLYHDGGLEQITKDHTLVQILVESGTISPEQARNHKRRNVVTNVIGGPSLGVHAEIYKVELADGDVVMLCSDGLNESISDDAVANVLADFKTPDDACARLTSLALEAGAPDNVTVVVARYRIV